MSAFALRLFACAAMLLDHIGYCLGTSHPLYLPLRIVGRTAFPIFVFLIVNGFRHTSDRRRYALRLGVFALISQIPYSLFVNKPSVWSSGSVFFTLLLCLLTVWLTDALRRSGRWRVLMPLPALTGFCLFYFGFLRADYGAKGILMATVFYLFDGNRVLTAVGLLVALLYEQLLSALLALLHLLRGQSAGLVAPTQWQLLQLFALLALVPIFLYNGKKGGALRSPAAAKAVQLGFYLFYPAHLLLLWAIR